MPQWSTAKTREAEARVLARIEAAFSVQIIQTPDVFHPVDAILFYHSRPTFAAEIKVRSHPRGAFPDVWLERRKYEALMAHQLIGLFIVGWSCGTIGWVRVNTLSPAFVWRERTDRGLPEDRDEVLLVPVSAFRVLA